MGSSRLRLLLSACLLTVGAVVFPLGTGVASATPTPDFTWAPQEVVTGTPVTFTSTSTPLDDLNPITSYAWSISCEGGPSTESTCTRTAPTAGPWQVTLTVGDLLGSAPVTKTITVVNPPPPPPPPNVPPTASFAALPSSPLPGDEVTFVSYSDDPDGRIASVAWDLDGDGGFDDGATAVATHKFSTPGPKTISLRVTDNGGAPDTASLTLTVRQPGTPAPPTASTPVTTPSGGQTVGNTVATAPLPRLLSPFPVVTVGGSLRPKGTKIEFLAVRAPQGSRVSVRCRGKGCRLKPLSKVVGRGRLRVKAAERLMPAGVALEVLVRRGDRIGKFTRLKLRDNKRPKRTDGCLWPGTAQLAPCPDS
jgi:PKD repeat protein